MQMSLDDDIISADNFFTGTRAAAFGGTTTIIDFVEAHPDQPLLDGLAERQAMKLMGKLSLITDYI
jgi:dihydropyrimidinase